ncbi:MAG: polysaccharide biosynthesis/export family protein, partial [bacterium]
MIKSKRLTALPSLFLMTTIFWGCAVRPKVKSPESEQTEPPPVLASVQEASRMTEYRLGFGDVIEIKFFRNSQFNESVMVRPDGRISLQKVGEVRVTGMTPSQLDSIITEAYAAFVLEPEVTVIVRQFGGYQVYVLGEVNAPGGYPIQRNMTILQALAAAGGAKISSKLGSVMLLRRSQTEEVEAIKVDLVKSVEAKNQLDIVQ